MLEVPSAIVLTTELLRVRRSTLSVTILRVQNNGLTRSRALLAEQVRGGTRGASERLPHVLDEQVSLQSRTRHRARF